MNRVIKFRCWDGKRMENGIPLTFGKGQDIVARGGRSQTFLVIGNTEGDFDDGSHWTLMQFTGLLDKNGKEIYEHDIIVTPQGSAFMVSWDEKMAIWELPRYEDESLFSPYEVIGNIYESPNLLNK